MAENPTPVEKRVCPMCADRVTFADPPPAAGTTSLALRANPTCPACSGGVPQEYLDHYRQSPPVVFSLMGLTSNGKTSYVCALLHSLRNPPAHWRARGFFYNPVGGTMDRVAESLQQIQTAGVLPQATQKIFPAPAIWHLGPSPETAPCQVVVYDTAGEAFRRSDDLGTYARYVAHSRSLVLLVSPTEGDATPDGMTDLLSAYVNAIRRLRGDLDRQQLVVVLTKADRFLGMPAAPASVKRFLAREGDFYDIDRDPGAELLALSDDIRQWFGGAALGFGNFVNAADHYFNRRVRYCVVSATGSPPVGGRLREALRPRGIFVPLYFIQAFQLPRVKVCGPDKAVTGYFSLAEALAAAPAGSAVELSDGEFVLETSILLDKPLTIVGAGREYTRVTGAGRPDRKTGAAGCVIGVVGPIEVRFENVQFEASGPPDAHAVWADDAKVTFARCGFTRRGGPAAGADGCGLLLTGAASGVVTGCEFARHPNSGIYLTDTARGDLADNACRGGGWGIFFNGTSTGTARSNKCCGNSRGGIRVNRWSAPVLRGNECDSNAGYGIEVAPHARPTLSGNVCRQNGAGAARGMGVWARLRRAFTRHGQS